MFMIVFGIHCNFFIVLPIRLKTCSFNGFFNFYKAKCACQKNQAGLRGFARPTTPDWHLARNFSRLDFAPSHWGLRWWESLAMVPGRNEVNQSIKKLITTIIIIIFQHCCICYLVYMKKDSIIAVFHTVLPD